MVKCLRFEEGWRPREVDKRSSLAWIERIFSRNGRLDKRWVVSKDSLDDDWEPARLRSGRDRIGRLGLREEESGRG